MSDPEQNTTQTRSTILVADDAPEYLMLLGEILSPHYNVRIAGNGASAIELASNAPQPSLILLDVEMPGMGGHETLRRLREQATTRDIPVIFVTAAALWTLASPDNYSVFGGQSATAIVGAVVGPALMGLTLGIVGVGLLAVPVLAGSTAYAVSEAFGWREGLGLKLRQARAFYVVILASMALFGMPMRGNWWTLQLVVGLFLVGALSTGLLISTVAETQQVAFQMSLLSSFLPTFILSGFIFPIASMPVPLQYITRIVPARYFLIALRGIVLKGVGLPVIWPQLVSLAIYSSVVLLLASARLRRQWR